MGVQRLRRSFKLITLFGIPVEINFSWFIILGLVIFTLAHGYFPLTNPELPVFSHWVMAVVAAILLFASLLAHEFSHSLVAQKNKLPIRGITLFVFGGVAHMEKEPSSPAVELKMAAAGPAMSFFLSLSFWLATQLFYSLGLPRVLLSITSYLYLLNLVVGVFNLIPGFPLDGGRVLRAILWSYYQDIKKATGIASALGKGFAFFLIAVGFLNLFGGSIISGIWFIFIGLFLQEAAEISYQQVVMKKVLTGVRVENIMTKNVITAPAHLSLNELIDEYFFKYRFAAFPVVEDDKLLGIITLHHIKEIDRGKWPQTRASEAMIPISASLLVSKETEATEALVKMASAEVGRLLIVEDSKLIGILSRRDILKLFEFKAEIEEE